MEDCRNEMLDECMGVYSRLCGGILYSARPLPNEIKH